MACKILPEEFSTVSCRSIPCAFMESNNPQRRLKYKSSWLYINIYNRITPLSLTEVACVALFSDRLSKQSRSLVNWCYSLTFSQSKKSCMIVGNMLICKYFQSYFSLRVITINQYKAVRFLFIRQMPSLGVSEIETDPRKQFTDFYSMLGLFL